MPAAERYAERVTLLVRVLPLLAPTDITGRATRGLGLSERCDGYVGHRHTIHAPAVHPHDLPHRLDVRLRRQLLEADRPSLRLQEVGELIPSA